MKIRNQLYALAFAGASFALPSTSYAALVYQLSEVGSDVVLTLASGGSLDLNGLNYAATNTGSGGLNPSVAEFVVGSGSLDLYIGLASGPATIGSGTSVPASLTSGLAFGFTAITGGYFGVGVTAGYVSGSTIQTISTSTFSSATLSSLGVTAGTYVWTLANNDTITLQAASNSSVPETNSTVAGLGLALAGMGLLRRRQRRAPEAARMGSRLGTWSGR